MFSKTINKFSTHDDYMTPKYVWKQISQYIPKDKVIWEGFYGDGTSGQYLRELGCKKVIHDAYLDFFQHDLGDICITNPAFTVKKETLQHLVKLKKPFILLLPYNILLCKYFRELFNDKTIQLIIPSKRIHFQKVVNGIKEKETRPSFDCIYYCWKMNLPKDIIYLEKKQVCPYGKTCYRKHKLHLQQYH